MPKIKPLTPREARAWDVFVRERPDGTFFHLSPWQDAIARVFGHRTHYLLAEQDGAITGVLPLVHMRSVLFGSALASVPFCVYGGPLAVDEETQAALEAHATALRDRLGVGVLEFRCREARERAGFVERPALYETFRKPIEADHERNMKAIPRKQRAMVRKAMQNGLTSSCHRDARVLHRLYAESVRNLGTPVFPRRWFAALLDLFGSDADIVTVLDAETPIAAVLNFYFRDEVLPYYGGGGEEARKRAGNDFMYWEVMRRAADRGCRLFDFGRSKIGTGAHAFKHNWGFPAAPLHYAYALAPGASIPETNPNNPKYRAFIAAWKRLPLPVANAMGPWLVRGLG